MRGENYNTTYYCLSFDFWYLLLVCLLQKHHVCAFEITTTVQPAATQVSEHTFQELARSDVHPFVTGKLRTSSIIMTKEQDTDKRRLLINN